MFAVDASHPIRVVGINDRDDVGIFHERFERLDLARGFGRLEDGSEVNLRPAVLLLGDDLAGLYILPQDLNQWLAARSQRLTNALYLACVYDTTVIIQTTVRGVDVGCVDEASATLISMHARSAMHANNPISPDEGTKEYCELVRAMRKQIPWRYSAGGSGMTTGVSITGAA